MSALLSTEQKKISDHAVEHTGAGAVRWSVFSASRPETLQSIFSGMHRDFPVYDENDWYRLLTGKLIINVCINPLTALSAREKRRAVKK